MYIFPRFIVKIFVDLKKQWRYVMEEKILLLNTFLKSIKFKQPQSYLNLTIVPLFNEQTCKNPYVLLEDALKTGKFTIKEVSQSGSVPELFVINELEQDVLLLEGDILIGAKQHRTINATMIVGRKSEQKIPVSCVERGRWSYRSDKFSASDFFTDLDLRMIKARSVGRSLKQRRRFDSNQGDIWDEINRKQVFFKTYSHTESIDDVYFCISDSTHDYLENFDLLEGQTGFGVFINGQLFCIEIFGIDNVIEKVFEKVLGSYIHKAIEFIRVFGEGQEKKLSNFEELLKANIETVYNLKKDCFKSVGEGFDLRFESQDLTGYALEHNSKIVHMASFFSSKANGKLKEVFDDEDDVIF